MYDHLHSHLYVGPNKQVRVDFIGEGVNAMVMDPANYQAYLYGAQFYYHGGHYPISPALVAPGVGWWNVVVDLGGLPGQIQAQIQVV